MRFGRIIICSRPHPKRRRTLESRSTFARTFRPLRSHSGGRKQGVCPICSGGHRRYDCYMTPSAWRHLLGTIFSFAMSSSSSVFGQSHSPCCRQSPRPAVVLSEKKPLAMVWQASLRPYLVADVRREPITREGLAEPPPEPQLSDLNLSANSPWITNSGGSLQYGTVPAAEQFHSRSFPLSRREEKPPLFAWLPGWRLETDRGLFHYFRNQASVLAFSYSDIFETRSNPDKGGHGLAILLRHELGKSRKSRGPHY